MGSVGSIPSNRKVLISQVLFVDHEEKNINAARV